MYRGVISYIYIHMPPLSLHSPNLPLQLPITRPSTLGRHIVQIRDTQHLFALIIAHPATDRHTIQRNIGDALLYTQDSNIGKGVHVGKATAAGGEEGGRGGCKLNVC